MRGWGMRDCGYRKWRYEECGYDGTCMEGELMKFVVFNEESAGDTFSDSQCRKLAN